MRELLVTTGAVLRCSFGAVPGALTVLPDNLVMVGGLPAATIMDHAPVINIPPFGSCASAANPAVAAAGGPAPCVPATSAPWTPGVPTVAIGNVPALTGGCRLTCAWGGVIEVESPGQASVVLV